VHEIGLVARRHDHKAGQAAEIGDVERPGMGLAVLSDKAGPVNREANGQLLDRDVMHDLVVAALQESRIDRGEGLHAFGGEARAKVTACCSAIPTSKVRFGNLSPNRLSPVPEGIAAVIAMMRSSFSASLISDLAKTVVYCGAFGVDFACAPVTTVRISQRCCHLSSACSAER